MLSTVDTIAAILLTYGVHSAVGCLLALVVARTLSRPQDREVLWKAALVAPLFTTLGALLSAVTRRRGAFVDLAESLRRVVGPGLRVPRREITIRVLRQGDTPTVERHFVDPVATTLTVVAIGVAMIVVAVAIVRFAHRRRALSRAIAQRELVDQSVDAGGIRLSSVDGLQSPVALGTREICLPCDVMTDFTEAHAQSLIAHEMAHLERRDPAWFCAVELIAACSAFQPLVFVVARAFRRDVELICDESAIRRTNDAGALIGALARLASPFDDASTLYGAATAYDGSPLVARAERIASLQHVSLVAGGRRAGLVAAAAITLASCAVPMFSATPRVSDIPSDPIAASERARAHGRRVSIDTLVTREGLVIRRAIIRNE